MDAVSYRTSFLKKSACLRGWWLVDARDQVVGRLAARVSRVLMGKHKPSYTPNMLCGDKVIIIHADKVCFTGRKWSRKVYIRHTGYPGGQRRTSAREMLQKHPGRLLEMAIKRMLPKNRMGHAQYRGLYVYAGAEHPHEAHKPVVKDVKDL